MCSCIAPRARGKREALTEENVFGCPSRPHDPRRKASCSVPAANELESTPIQVTFAFHNIETGRVRTNGTSKNEQKGTRKLFRNSRTFLSLCLFSSSHAFSILWGYFHGSASRLIHVEPDGARHVFVCFANTSSAAYLVFEDALLIFFS